MRKECLISSLAIVVLVSIPEIGWGFSSGSTGALGALNPSSNTVIDLSPYPDGILNYTTVNIPNGVTVSFMPNPANTPVTILATGDVAIAGTLDSQGAVGAPSDLNNTSKPGAQGGPGGYRGGNSAAITSYPASEGQGPGGGAPGTVVVNGLFPLNTRNANGDYGVSASVSLTLIPLVGGSGGGGGGAYLDNTNYWHSGGSGGGGGGAILIASSTAITISGSINANGGDGGDRWTNCGTFNPRPNFQAGGGSGGAIRLVAPVVTATDTAQILAVGGYQYCSGVRGSYGRIRMEGGTLNIYPYAPQGYASYSSVMSGVSPSSTPPLSNFPTLRIAQVNGIATPQYPAGSYGVADVSLPGGSTNPVTVRLEATNIPVGTVFAVRLIPQSGDSVVFYTPPSTGTFASSSATVMNVNLPLGQTSVLNAYANITVTAGLFPLIEGEEVERIMVAANYGESSVVTLLTKSGRKILLRHS